MVSSWISTSPAELNTCWLDSSMAPGWGALIVSVMEALPFIWRLPAGSETDLGVLHVLAHRLARGRRVARRDRLQQLAMLDDGLPPDRLAEEVRLELHVQRSGAHLPQLLHDQQQRAVAARFGDAQ